MRLLRSNTWVLPLFRKTDKAFFPSVPRLPDGHIPILVSEGVIDVFQTIQIHEQDQKFAFVQTGNTEGLLSQLLDDVYIVCENNSYGVYRNDDDSLTDTVTISQNEAGIDTEDRIIKLKKYIANMK